MRETLAKGFAVFVGMLAVMGALTFATRLNPRTGGTPAEESAAPSGATIVPAVPVDPVAVERGRVVFGEQECARCHSVAGVGNPRNPLDGIGSRRTRAAMRDWIVGAPAVRRELTPTTLRAKERYAGLAEADLEALAVYLSTLR